MHAHAELLLSFTAAPSPTSLYHAVVCVLLLLVVCQVAAKSTFFEDRIGLFSLNDTDEVLLPHCTSLLADRGITELAAPASQFVEQLGQQYGGVDRPVMEQCLVEQRYVRGAQLRTLIYNQVQGGSAGQVVAVHVCVLCVLCVGGGLEW